MARLTRRIAVGVWRWQYFVKLAEFVFEVTFGLAHGISGLRGN
jgi:hypothetical protein